MQRYWLSLVLVAAVPGFTWAKDTGVSDSSGQQSVQYERDRGLTFTSGETDLWLGVRGQFRFTTPSTSLDPESGTYHDDDNPLSVNRARIKGGGTLVRDWISFYGEYNLKDSQWLDYRSTIAVNDWLDVRFGQWKSEFSRERYISSANQQLVERSISTYWFTLDRQRGLSTSARFGAGTRADLQIWIQALSGLGLNRATERDNGLIMARVQWSPDGEQLPFSGSDLKRREEPLRSLAVALVTGETQCSRFSSDGCGQLPGYQESEYDLDQLMFETGMHYRGLGWEQELHVKRVRDKVTGSSTTLVGGYMQFGSFLNEWLPRVPPPLEIVGRYALVDPDTGTSSDLQQEWTLGANWFFSGHRNKLSLDFTWLDTGNLFDHGSQTRLQLQWELSL